MSEELIEIINRQADDPGLWVDPATAVEAYLQQALRELHAVIENDKLALFLLKNRRDNAHKN